MVNWIIWHITNRCNLKCNYCFAGSNPIASEGLTSDHQMKVAEIINASGAKLVTIIGGEPLTVRNLPQIVEKLLCVPGREINIDTNGMLLKERWANVYQRVNRFNISVDALNAEVHNAQRGGYRKVMNALSFLKEKGAFFGSTITVTNRNCHFLEETAEFLVARGASVVGFGRVKPIARGTLSRLMLSEKEMEIAVEQIVRFYKRFHSRVQIIASGFYSSVLFEEGPINRLPYCVCGDRKVTVNYDGTVYPCEIIPFLFEQNDFRLKFGKPLNLLENSLEEIMQSPLMCSWRNTVYTDPAECVDCRFRLYCNTGCRALNYFLTKRDGNRDPACTL